MCFLILAVLNCNTNLYSWKKHMKRGKSFSSLTIMDEICQQINATFCRQLLRWPIMILVGFNLVWSPHSTRANLGNQENKEVTAGDVKGSVTKVRQALPGAPGRLGLGRVTHWCARTIEQPCGKGHVKRHGDLFIESGNELASYVEGRVFRQLRSVFSRRRQTLEGWSPRWHLHDLMRNSEPKLPKWTPPKTLTHRNQER